MIIFSLFSTESKQANKKSLQNSINSDQCYMEKLMCVDPKAKKQASTSVSHPQNISC